jgi:hypothetical protein
VILNLAWAITSLILHSLCLIFRVTYAELAATPVCHQTLSHVLLVENTIFCFPFSEVFLMKLLGGWWQWTVDAQFSCICPTIPSLLPLTSPCLTWNMILVSSFHFQFFLFHSWFTYSLLWCKLPLFLLRKSLPVPQYATVYTSTAT